MVLVKKNNYLKFAYILLICNVCFYGCAYYSLKGSLPAHIRNISITPVSNESTEFGISEKVSEYITDLLITENILDVTSEEFADSRLNVVIKRVDDNPFTYTLPDNASYEKVEEYRITIHASVIWYDLTVDEALFKINKTSWGAYGAGLDISTDKIDNDGDGYIDGEDEDEFGSPRDSAINVAIRKLSEDIINELTSTW